MMRGPGRSTKVCSMALCVGSFPLRTIPGQPSAGLPKVTSQGLPAGPVALAAVSAAPPDPEPFRLLLPMPDQSLPDTHLDLGCGKRPRNPYRRASLYGVDIRALTSTGGVEVRAANLSVEPIPFPDNHFGSVSGFDFIEHIPRILPTPDGQGTVFPFIRLMNEVWRVLAPGGRFYALTPAWPNPEVYVDPTHVNVITEKSHEYFCGERPLGRMYGFEGHFEARRVGWVHFEEAEYAVPPFGPSQHAKPFLQRTAHALRDTLRLLRGRPRRRVHFLWELEAIKGR